LRILETAKILDGAGIIFDIVDGRLVMILPEGDTRFLLNSSLAGILLGL
jgi:hypothetical protein